MLARTEGESSVLWKELVMVKGVGRSVTMPGQLELEVDDIVYEILRNYSPAPEGIGISESMNILGKETYFSEQVPQVAEVIVSDSPEDNLLPEVVTPSLKTVKGRKKKLSGTVKSVETVLAGLRAIQNEEKFTTIFYCDKFDKLDLEPLTLPNIARPPKRFCGPGKQNEWNSCEQYSWQEYYKVIETATVGLQ
ncbi:hypothetical protein PR048_018298 [Dryococelus australis]|uniref:Uncharacterized protein n=1 Tax=Dryococelus australis TaxID=614101 RepID=A0ABQ9HC26_9NEOP|nr:hypothetical protein PR048_018298 [Dryococelus australis]